MNDRSAHATGSADSSARPQTDARASTGRVYWLDQPRNVRRLYLGLWAVGIVLVLADFVVHRHDELGFAATAGYYAAYGFAACVLLVLTAKGLRRLLKRPEDYYER